ncbi:hypothetical protein IAI18_18240 [Acetobacteraceae bacterium H6797]|nr:hypothetical protein [Acetobacteraceae bacterium H6797]
MHRFTKRFLPVLALSGALLTAACQNPDGSTDWGSTLALGAGVGLAAGLIAGSANDDGYRRNHYRRPPPRHYGHRGYYADRGYYGRPYRGW